MGSCRLSSFAKVLRGSFVRAISSAGMCARKQGRGVYAVRHLAIHVKKALIFREIASWAERSAFPKWQEGQHPHCHFRGLLRLYACYGPSDRSATQGDLCHEASVPPVAQRNRSSASGLIDNYPGGTLLHW